MSHRILASMAFVVAIIVLTLVPIAGQAPSAAGPTAAATKTWTPPRTPDGQPNLQGYWASATPTPLERPNQYAGREFLTEEEYNKTFTEVVESFEDDLRGRVIPDTDPGPISIDRTAYDNHWYDRQGKPLRRTSLIIDPPDGKVPPLKPEAQKRFDAWEKARGMSDTRTGGVDGRGSRADNPEDRRLGERCITRGLPSLPGPAGIGNRQIVQTPDYVVIEMEWIHEARVIPLDGRPHLPPHVRQLLGDSRGHWERNTLVIDTTNFTDRAPFWGSFDGLHLVERLTLVDADTINYEVTVDDPTTFTKPWTAVFPLTRMQDKVPLIFEYACHEGNYGLEGQLSSARAEDRARAATKNGKKGSR